MDGFICPKCGKVKPSIIYDSCPSQADCPKCGAELIGNDGIKIMSEDEARKFRPEFYKKYDEEKLKRSH